MFLLFHFTIRIDVVLNFCRRLQYDYFTNPDLKKKQKKTKKTKKKQQKKKKKKKKKKTKKKKTKTKQQQQQKKKKKKTLRIYSLLILPISYQS